VLKQKWASGLSGKGQGRSHHFGFVQQRIYRCLKQIGSSILVLFYIVYTWVTAFLKRDGVSSFLFKKLDEWALIEN
jgi:hypothetical protein